MSIAPSFAETVSSVQSGCFQQEPEETGEQVISARFTGKQNDLPFEQSELLILMVPLAK